MAEEKQAPAAPAAAAEVVVVEAEVAKPLPRAPEPKVEKKEEKVIVEATTEVADADVAEASKDKETEIPQSASFKEETNVVADLIDPEKKALDELRELIAAALANNEFTKPPPPPVKEEKKKEEDVGEKEVVVEEGEKSEEPKKEEEGETKKEAEETKKEDEPTKPEPESEPCAPAKEEKLTPADVEEEKNEIDDGAKTVEAIKETVVQVAAAAAAAPEVVVKEEEKKPEEAEVVGEEEKKKPEAAEVVAEEEEEEEEEKLPPPPPEEVFIWGLPLLGGEKSDTILLKFLRARDFKVKDALTMIKNTVIWRKEFGIEELLEQDLGVSELEKVVFMHGLDKEGHPVCYNVYGEFQEKELYQKAFGDEEKRKNFLRWRVQALEKGIRQKLDFSPEGVCTMVQVTDLKNSPGPWKKELRQATKQALDLLHDNYPEFAAKQIFINVPWWYLAFNRMIAPFFTQRSKSKFVFAGLSKSAETLFKYIAPEQVPVQYGGLSMDNDTDFCAADAVTEVSIKPASKHTIEIPVAETCLLVWELRVLGWDVSYGAEFVPDAEGGYTVIVQKMRKYISTDEAVVKNSFKIGEPGKVVLTVDNATSKKKKLLYRSKTKSSTD